VTTTTLHRSDDAHLSYRVVHVATCIVRAGCFVAFSILAALAVIVAAASAMSPRSSLSVMGHDVLIVRSGSMHPSIATGDAVLVRPATASTRSHLRVGQVVTFRTEANADLVVTHRIVDVSSAADGTTTYATRGDANGSVDDTKLSPDHVVGVVTGRIPRGGYVLSAIQKPEISGLFLIAFLLAHAGVLATRTTVPQREKRETHET
jgi:signal peptidase